YQIKRCNRYSWINMQKIIADDTVAENRKLKEKKLLYGESTMGNNVIRGFFQVGYLIKLGENLYFRQIFKERIKCGKEWEARFFGSYREAESLDRKSSRLNSSHVSISYAV